MPIHAYSPADIRDMDKAHDLPVIVEARQSPQKRQTTTHDPSTRHFLAVATDQGLKHLLQTRNISQHYYEVIRNQMPLESKNGRYVLIFAGQDVGHLSLTRVFSGERELSYTVTEKHATPFSRLVRKLDEEMSPESPKRLLTLPFAPLKMLDRASEAATSSLTLTRTISLVDGGEPLPQHTMGGALELLIQAKNGATRFQPSQDQATNFLRRQSADNYAGPIEITPYHGLHAGLIGKPPSRE